jgi:hypothetical protein
MKHRLARVVLAAFVVLAGSASAFGQGASTATISGVVVDPGGLVIPGASVVVKNSGTGEEFTTVTSDQGVFAVPSLITGRYTVTISLDGFKSAVFTDVVINAGVPANLRATLELGGLTEQVIVQSNVELVQTATATVSTTLQTRQVQDLPLSSRNAADFITFLPGVTTPGGTRDSIVNGLPQSTINMTLDGVNIQDNTNKTTDGFFAIVGPRLDAVEEITFSSAAQGADSVGMGATQIRFVTRSGTNQFLGSFFHTYRSDELNANTWFNKRDGLEKAELLLNQPGFNVGGPVRLPGYDGRGRAFFFLNYEELRQPASIRRTRTILHPSAEQGIFRYNSTSGVQSVNLFELAARNGQLATPDPVISRLLADIRAATGITGAVREQTDPLYQQYLFQVPTQALNRYPTLRLDYQLNDRHRVTYSMNYQYFGGGPDTTNNREAQFPGFPVVVDQWSVRRQSSAWLRSVFGSSIVNEARFGYGGAPVAFGMGQYTPDLYNGSIANQAGFFLNLNNAVGITNAGFAATPSERDAFTTSVENTVNWQKGSHSLNFGGSFQQFDLWMDNQQVVPELRFDILQGDPAEGLFTQANFPGASNANINEAGDLYALLTGRISEVRGVARLNEQTGRYEYLGLGTQRAQQRQIGLWFQDSWKARPNVTINAGLRYEMQFPFVAKNNSYSIGDLDDVYGVSGVGNIFKPGTLTGERPTFRQLSEGEQPYPMDWNNVAPSLGIVWTPSAQRGFLRRLTGEVGDMALRAGYSRAYTRLGLGTFTGEIASNPGVSLNVFRDLAQGNLGPLPLLLRDSSRLGPASFSETPQFPYTEVVTGDIRIFSPDLKVPYADTWQAGVTRALGRSMSIEARYLGAVSRDNWRANNYNELNILENGFLDEFRLAQANLRANIAAGRGATFAYAGPGTGTSPLPIYLAYFNGVNRDRAGDPSLYTSANFRSATFVNPLARFNPNPYAAADALDADLASRNRAINAGLPSNFLLANPDLLGGALITENTTDTAYNSLMLEFRRRMSGGLQYSMNYVMGHATNTTFLSLRVDPINVRNGGEEGDVSHAYKANLVYELPFGQGRRFANGAGAVLDRIIGGWQLAGNVRVQSGRLLDFGNVRLVGMNEQELRDMFQLRIADDGRVWMLPQDVIDESVKAFSTSATSATGYSNLGVPTGRYIAPADSVDCIETIRGFGDCGLRSVIVQGPLFKQFDLSLVKRLPLWGRINAEFRLDALNVVNTVNFAPVNGITLTNNRADGSDPDDYEITGLTGTNTARVLQIVSRIRW